MNIILNGKPLTIDAKKTVRQFITDQGLSGKRIAVEINAEIIPRSTFDNTLIKTNDKIEIVHAIGGG